MKTAVTHNRLFALGRALVLCGAGMAIVAVYVALRMVAANTLLDRLDFAVRPASGATFYAAKKQLLVGQRTSRQELTEHLGNIGFVHGDVGPESAQPGSYWFRDSNSIVVEPRLPEFKRVEIIFSGRRIARILETNPPNPTATPVTESSLEPEPLGTFVLSINGDERKRMFVQREFAPYSSLEGTHLYYGAIASEDSLFPRHNGTRFDRILKNALTGGGGGGSSITAQVIKNAVSFDRTRGLPRKIDEVFLSAALEARFSKERIFELYANHVFLGGEGGSPNVYGFLAAAREYFGKASLSDLSLSESATLVAMLPQPNRFLKEARRGDYGRLTAQRNRVLRRLVEVWPDRYSDETVSSAASETLRFRGESQAENELDFISRAFIHYANSRQPLVKLGDLPDAEYSGLHIYTSIDPDLMREAQQILERSIPSIEQQYPPNSSTTCNGTADSMLGAIVAVNPGTGEILTMAGGAGGPGGSQYAGFALNARAAPASTVKPLLLARALEKGFALEPGPGLASGSNRIGPLLARSDRQLALSILSFLGAQEAVSFYEKVTGLSVNPSEAEALAMGAAENSEISILGLSRAYTLFANNGMIREMEPISEVYMNGHRVELERQPTSRVTEPRAAFATVQMMRAVLGYGKDGAHGTARDAFRRTGLPRDTAIAAKTGSAAHEVWMASASPRLVVSVLLTYRCHSTIRNSEKLFAADTAAPIWAAYIDAVRRRRPDLLGGEFEAPAHSRKLRNTE